jgi:hypothetical protein
VPPRSPFLTTQSLPQKRTSAHKLPLFLRTETLPSAAKEWRVNMDEARTARGKE